MLSRLTSAGVDFVIVGGYAVGLHGSPRITSDLDITYAPDDANLEVLGTVLERLNARLRGVEEDVPFVPDHRTLRRVELLTLDTRYGGLDLLAKPPGAPPYASIRARAQRVDLGGLRVLLASIDDLIAMKAAADRPIDRAHIEELQAIQRLTEG